MVKEPDENDPGADARTPDTEDLQEPSTEKDAAEVPRADEPGEAEPSHRAVGIGVIDVPPEDPGS